MMSSGEYMKVSEGKYLMKGGVTDTLFGLIGSTTGQSRQKTLGGLVTQRPDGPVPSDLKKGRVAVATERHIGGKNATAVAGCHYGQVPYPGKFMKTKGAKL
jgi:hypothetical protein